MEDEKGPDAKIVAVPARHVDPNYSDVDSVEQLPEFTRRQIEHFFQHYKESEPGKFVTIDGWKDDKHAKDLITRATMAYGRPARSLRAGPSRAVKRARKTPRTL
jgi:inorganic pyrophosphatase